MRITPHDRLNLYIDFNVSLVIYMSIMAPWCFLGGIVSHLYFNGQAPIASCVCSVLGLIPGMLAKRLIFTHMLDAIIKYSGKSLE